MSKHTYTVTIEVPMEITVNVELDEELSGNHKEDNEMLVNTITKDFWDLRDTALVEEAVIFQDMNVLDVGLPEETDGGN